MTLLGVMLVMLFGGLRLGHRAWDRGSEGAERGYALAQVERFLRRTLAGAQPLVVQEEKGRTLAFSGQEDALLFAAPLPAQAALPGLYWIAIAAREGKLLLRFQPFDPEKRAMEGNSEAITLLEGVKGITLRYFGEAQPGAGAQWQDRWEKQAILPAKVSLTLDTAPPWPEMVFPLRLSTYRSPSFLPRRPL